MSDIVIFGIILWVAVLLFLIVTGNELFSIMVDERLRYLRLIVNYAQLPATAKIPHSPEPVARYTGWALGENRDPVGCVHIRHAGRIRYGETGRWLDMGGRRAFPWARRGSYGEQQSPGFPEYGSKRSTIMSIGRPGCTLTSSRSSRSNMRIKMT